MPDSTMALYFLFDSSCRRGFISAWSRGQRGVGEWQGKGEEGEGVGRKER